MNIFWKLYHNFHFSHTNSSTCCDLHRNGKWSYNVQKFVKMCACIMLIEASVLGVCIFSLFLFVVVAVVVVVWLSIGKPKR